ncbi:MAG: hypothetical protein WCP69_11200 [Bacteroidota bacterium]
MTYQNTLIKNAVKHNAIILISTILLTFIVVILLLTKTISVEPNVAFAHLLLKISIPATLFTFLCQIVFYKIYLKKLHKIKEAEEKLSFTLRLFSERLNATLFPIALNIIFLCLTNFDMFLVLNVVLVLWMLNLFPFAEKIKTITGIKQP